MCSYTYMSLVVVFIHTKHINPPPVLSPPVLQDRADRAVRYAKTQEEEKAAREALLQARQAEQEARREAVVRERR